MGNFLTTLGGILKERGDHMSAKITKTDRQVVKIHTKEKGKYSATKYPNGTVVETRTTRHKK